MELDDTPHLAGRLISFGMQARVLPRADDEYRELLARYRTDPRFQQAVDQFASGLGLRVTNDSQLGFYLAATADSPFAYTLSDFRRERGMSDASGAVARGLYGLVVVGIAAYFYPLPQHLSEESHPTATATQIDAFIRAACEELRARLGDEDPEQHSAEREPAWRAYLRQKETSRGSDGRRGQQGTLLAVEKMLELFVERQLISRMNESSDEASVRYQPLERFRHQVARFAGEELFEALGQIRLGAGRAATPGGLHVDPGSNGAGKRRSSGRVH
jgi:hypothetical protein